MTVPPGWPAAVRPPGAPDWERTARAWLLDQAPPEYRGYDALRRHDLLLARFTVLHVDGSRAGVDRGLSEARAELRDLLDARGIEAGIETLQAEAARLLVVRRAAGLVEDALRGRRFVPRL